MNSMKGLTQLVLRSPISRNKKAVALKYNFDKCYFFNNKDIHTYKNNVNINNKIFKNECIQPIQLRQSSINFSTKNVRSKVSETFTDDLHDIQQLLPGIIQELVQEMIPFSIPESVDRLKQILEYNMAGGKNFRAGLLIKTYKSVTKNVSAADLKLAYLLAWCLELNHSFFIILDDIVDGSTTRRNHLCWYKVKDVGLMAINDGIMMEHFVYCLLRKHFSHLDCYMDLVHLFLEITQITSCGQASDLVCCKQNVGLFTREKYHKIVFHKTSYYTIFMPIMAGMYLSGCKDKNLYDDMKNVLLELGLLYQMHDDFIDCFCSKEITGKSGTDIIENKCTWLAAECMHLANDNQKRIMMECYGSNDPEKVARVKQLYTDLDLPRVYADCEREISNKIKQSLNKASDDIPKDVILKILDELMLH